MDPTRRRFGRWGAACAAAAAWPTLARSGDAYPSRPVRFIIPFSAGGGSDIVGRAVCAKLGESLGRTFVPENRAGGNSVIGLDACAKAKPDGYTLSLLTSSATVNVTLQGAGLPYDLERDFAPVTQITVQPYFLVVNADLPIRSVADLIAVANRRPEGLNYGTSGTGGISQLAGALLGSMARVKMTAVPYKGGNPALIDVVSGQIDLMFSSRLQAQPFLSSGRLRAIAVTSTRRSVAAPDVPTLAESGLPGYDVAGWYGLAAPAGTPAAIVDTLQRNVAKAVGSPEIQAKLALDGSEGVGSTPPQFAEHIRAEVAKWRRLIREMGIRND